MSIIDSFGNSLSQSSMVGSIRSSFDFLKGGGSPTEIPAQPILSSQYKLEFYIGNNPEPIKLFDIDNITKTLITSEKKNFRPYGFTHKINLINYDGWDIKISGKKIGPQLNYLIQKIYESTSYPGYQSPNLAIPNQPIVIPMFKMIETIESNPAADYSPRTREQYEYKNIVINGYDEEVSGDNMPLTFTLSLVAKSREMVAFEDDDSGEIKSQIDTLIQTLSRQNKQIIPPLL